MKIIDFNKKNKTLICEIGEAEYKRIITALDKVYPPYLVAHTRFNEDELKGRINAIKNGGLIALDDEIKPKLSKVTLDLLNGAIDEIESFLIDIKGLPEKAVNVTTPRDGLTLMFKATLNTLKQIKKEVA